MGSSKHKRKSRSRSRSRDRVVRKKEKRRSASPPKSALVSKQRKHSRKNDSSPDTRRSSHRTRKRSSSESSASSSDSSNRRPRKTSTVPLIEELEKERQRLKLEKKKAKEALKATETPEQKRLRRLAKKEAKERKRKAQMGWDEEYLGYTNTDNPFGDANLLKSFKWEKKFEKEGLKNAAEEEIERRNRLKLEENRRELEKVKQRRLEREREQEEREEELTRIQRDKEAAQFQEWEKQEDIFHLQQAKLRSKIRIEDGRAKPIDLLARYISAEEEDFGVEMLEPYIYLNGLTVQDLEDLQEDIKVYMELENSRNLNYWRDVQIIVEEELRKLRRLDTSSVDHQIVERREGINAAVSTEVVDVFKGKTPGQLQALYAQIQKRIHSKEEGLDVPYWETLLSRLKAYMARARLRERHQENLRRKLFQLKQEQGVDSGPLFPCVKKESPSRPDGEGSPQPGPSGSQPGEASEVKEEPSERPASSAASTAEGEEEEEESKEGEAEEPAVVKYQRINPRPFISADPFCSASNTKRQPTVMRPTRPGRCRYAQMEVQSNPFIANPNTAISNTQIFRTKLHVKKYLYNKQLIDYRTKTTLNSENAQAPIQYKKKIENTRVPCLVWKRKEEGMHQHSLSSCFTVSLFFMSFFFFFVVMQDIAFKIVNREWEYSYKRGFRCQFHNNIFQLWFHFKRYRYRR
ncbi:unnamed protein product [Ixodes persulcatus]